MRQEGYRDKYYEQALKARTCVIEEYRTLFDEYDLLISPTMPMVAPTIDEATSLSPVETYAMDILTVGPNLAGLPHGSLPIGKGLPKGLLVIGDHFQDGTVLDFIEQHEGTI
jgi:aspartyl-tRNA(Asn)/glutamyl-tRNA(Gln) amidotransferase subunit A